MNFRKCLAAIYSKCYCSPWSECVACVQGHVYSDITSVKGLPRSHILFSPVQYLRNTWTEPLGANVHLKDEVKVNVTSHLSHSFQCSRSETPGVNFIISDTNVHLDSSNKSSLV